MINVSLLKNNDNLIGFEITGHADFDEYGKDIVCAGVSTLAYTVVNTVDNYINNFEFSDDDLLMRLEVCDLTDEVKVILSTFEIGIKTLSQSYGHYVKFNFKEI